jgi:Flp pilus assembly protein TadD
MALNGDSAGAVEQLQKAIVVDPGSVEFRFNLAYVLESRGEFESAIQPLERAVALSRKKDWRCLAELAKVYARTGRNAEAIESARAALELALKQNDQAAHALQQALDHYEQQGAAAKTN